MNKEEIDKFFEAYNCSDLEEILSCIDLNNYPEFNNLNLYEIDSILENDHKEVRKIYREIISNIEKGDYQYFLSLKDDKEKIECFSELVSVGSDRELKKYLLDNHEKYNIPDVYLTSLLLGTGDPNYVGKWIEKDIFSDLEVLIILKKIDNPEIAKEFLDSNPKYLSEDPEYSWMGQEILAITKDKDLIMNKIKEFKDKKVEINPELIRATKDKEFIKGIINNRSEYEISDDSIVILIDSLNDMEFLQKVVEDGEKFGLKSENIGKLIALTENEKFIDSAIHKGKELNLNLSDTLNLVVENGKDKYSKKDIDSLFKQYGIKNMEKENDDNTVIKLPEDMTVGIEIESVGNNSKAVELAVNEFNLAKNWNAKEDSSIETNGIEVVSPILTGNNISSSNNIKKVCKLLNSFGQDVDEDCGGHIHIGSDYLTSKESWINLLEICSNCEKEIFIISNKSGEKIRFNVAIYAKYISGNMKKALERGSIQMDSIEDIKKFAKSFESDRYFGVNFHNLGNNKNTIEFRMPNGTVDAKTWIENINLFGGIVKASEDLSKIQLKPEENITKEEKEKIETFNKLEKDETTPEEILEYLLKLAIKEEDRHIYRERYFSNKRQKMPNLFFKDNLANGRINIKSKVLADKFAKEEGVASKREESKNINEYLLKEEILEENKDRS